jgi:hypothetical protein
LAQTLERTLVLGQFLAVDFFGTRLSVLLRVPRVASQALHEAEEARE